MARKITVIILLITMAFLLCGCDNSSDNPSDIFPDNPLARIIGNTKAYIKIGEKTIAIDINAYMSHSNGTVTVYGIDGKTYKTHFMNVVLIKDAEGR